MTENLAVLLGAQVEVVGIDEKLGQVEELWDELLYIGHVVFGGREPALLNTVEHSVSEVEVTSLQSQEVLSERLQSHEVRADDHR